MLFNPEIFHRRSVRLDGHDYTAPGYYFVTICLHDIRCVLAVPHGNPPDNCSLQLTPIGEIAKKYWQEIPYHYPNVTLNEFVIMPDHMHGILQIRDGGGRGVQFSNDDTPNCRGVQLNAPTNWNKTDNKLNAPANINQTNDKSNARSNGDVRSHYFSSLSPAGRSLSVMIRWLYPNYFLSRNGSFLFELTSVFFRCFPL